MVCDLNGQRFAFASTVYFVLRNPKDFPIIVSVNRRGSFLAEYCGCAEIPLKKVSRNTGMKRTNSDKRVRGHSCDGIAVTEVIVSMGVAAVAIGCIISGYLLAGKAAELSASSAAVQWSVIQALEQTRSARWEPLAVTPVDELVQTNFPTSVVALDIPLKKKKVAYATNKTTITSLTGYPMLRMIRVETTWASSSRRPFTNSLVTYRSADR
jgi:hypothetical protein